MEKIKKIDKKLIIMFCYSIITFIIVMFHESWRDEAQAWLIVKNLDLIGVIKQMQYEGHPILWYLIIFPFAKIGLPYITIKIISWMICNVTVWLILKKAPFNLFVKILLISTTPMLYYYPAIARSYCLIPLAITLIAICYKKRHDRPILYILSILLLANTHVVVYGMVGILLLLFYIEELILNRKTNSKETKRKIYISLIIVIIGLILTIIPIFISVKTNTDVSLSSNLNQRLENSIEKIVNAFVLIIHEGFSSNPIIINTVIITLMLLLIYEIKYHKKNSLIILCSVGFSVIIYAFIYYCSSQRAGILIFMIMFIAWIQWEKRNIGEYLFIFILIINIICGINPIMEEINTKYSSAYETAQYIKNNLEDDSIFICTDMPFSSAVIPYINRNAFWSPQTEDYFSFVTWDEKYKTSYTVQEFLEKIKNNFNGNEKLYLLYSYNFQEEAIEYLENNEIITKIFTSDISENENFIIYEIKQ